MLLSAQDSLYCRCSGTAVTGHSPAGCCHLSYALAGRNCYAAGRAHFNYRAIPQRPGYTVSALQDIIEAGRVVEKTHFSALKEQTFAMY